MKPRYLRTADIATAIGVHPNTVRMYEVWGFLPPVPRGPNGNRLYTEAHLDQMRLARTALHGAWDEEILSAADRWLTTLTAQEQRAQSLIDQLQQMIRRRPK